MTEQRTPFRKIWMERAQGGYLQRGTTCARSRSGHSLADNKGAAGMAIACTKCHAGVALAHSQDQAMKDNVTASFDVRSCCWMCGGPFSSPRTSDEYHRQLCCPCLIALEGAKVLKLVDPKTKERGLPSSQTHTSR